MITHVKVQHCARTTLIAGLLVGALASCTQTQAQDQPTWTPQFENVDILDFIQYVQRATDKIMVIDPRVQGQVTVINSNALTRQQLYDLFLATLDVHGFTAVDVNNIVRITPKDQAKTEALP